MSGTVTVENEARDAVATVRFDNREKRNALGPPLIAELVDAFDELEDREGVRAVVLTGAGERAFSAGFDVSYHRRNYGDGPEPATEERELSDLADRVREFDYPVVAMLNGGAYGGAVHLAAACDLRVAVEDAEFGITPARLGLIYDPEAIHEVMVHVGPANAKELLFTGEFVDADRAHEMGLLNRVVPREDLEATTYDLAGTIADNAPLSLTGTKRIVRALIDHGGLTETELAWAEELREASENSRDHREGVEAFMEDREPEFEGR